MSECRIARRIALRLTPEVYRNSRALAAALATNSLHSSLPLFCLGGGSACAGGAWCMSAPRGYGRRLGQAPRSGAGCRLAWGVTASVTSLIFPTSATNECAERGEQ